MTNPVLSIIKSDVPEKWQQILSDLITEPKELLQILRLDPAEQGYSEAAMRQFPLKVPRPFVDRIERGNWQDPLLRQIWPAQLEEIDQIGYVADPLEEQDSNITTGLLHKYHGRVLLITAPHCAIHCRYCFRRHFDYHSNSPSRSDWKATFDYIAADRSIEEVIFSGGDPLALSDRHLAWLIDQVQAIDHVTTLRIHSRLPVVIPQRISPELINILGASRLKVVLVIHSNHGNELDSHVAAALGMLSAEGITLLNQTVVLEGVNNNSQTLIELSKKLFSCNVLPYYLHMPDAVAGTQHFAVDRASAAALCLDMQAALPGYLVPRLVQEEAGELSKTRLA